ncbi:PREDICTED: uncharacterized protein LOC104816969 [Tarenaya hassleriana]|uniref:uncharacterized protein LOC104816969 n=1 Tax=Tarenaya hassleriana TaxID=28532 RepID=UPI00053C282C|nr:PREDICTED: uncharacterized protein LOC104816969 [Tarenaya hassleriana]
MTRHVILRSPAVNKREPLLASESKEPATPPIIKSPGRIVKASAMVVTGERRKKAAEVAGGSAAECAAVCCCCPCAVVNLVVLAVYKVPAAMCKKALRRKKRRRFSGKRQGLLSAAEGSEVSGRLRFNGEDPTAETKFEERENTGGEQNDDVELDNEMWDHFHGAGFWRSPSQRDT